MRALRRTFSLTATLLLAWQTIHPQTTKPEQRLLTARALYYTPTTRGLRTFHCELSIDWKGLLSKARAKDVPEDDPLLKYLESARLYVTDDLKGAGSLDWENTGVPPTGLETSTSTMRDGMGKMIAGFFSSWNAYMNGTMVPVPGPTDKITETDSGLHMHASSEKMTVDESYDKNMLLTEAHVVTADLDATAHPVYTDTPEGRLVASIETDVKQPVTAPAAHINIGIDYQSVSSFQLPSAIHYDLKNVIQVDFNLTDCSAGSGVAAAKP